MPDHDCIRWTLRLFALAMVIFLFPAMLSAQSQRRNTLPAGDANVHQLRRQLDGLEQHRQDARNDPAFGWERNPRPLELSHEQFPDDEHAIIELHYAAREIPCFIRLTPEARSDLAPLHAPMLVRGSQWIRIPRGEWRIQLLAGYVTGPIIAFPEAIVKIDGGEVYRLSFGPDEEIMARDLAREASERIRKAGRLPGVTVAPSP